jgi:hypothetical protein
LRKLARSGIHTDHQSVLRFIIDCRSRPAMTRTGGGKRENQSALLFRTRFLYGRAPGEESVGMRNFGCVLMETMLLTSSVSSEAEAGRVEPGAELTPEMFKPLPEITSAKKGIAGIALLARMLILERFEASR